MRHAPIYPRQNAVFLRKTVAEWLTSKAFLT